MTATMAAHARALASGETTATVHAYASLRAALVAPDKLSVEALVALRDRVVEAAQKYPADLDLLAQYAENTVLQAYAAYLSAVIMEAMNAGG